MRRKSNQNNEAASVDGNNDREILIRVTLDQQKEGMFVCPACNNSVAKDLSKIVNAPKVIQINCKCKCGHTYQVLVDRRSIIREAVNFVGLYHCDSSAGQPNKGLIKILDISMSGLQFSVNKSPNLTVGDRITVEFNLDDWDRSKVREEGIVRWIHSNRVGIQFDSIDRFSKLGLYLLE